MSCIVFRVEERNSGWFVGGGELPIGPFFSKVHAVELAAGMVEALRNFGDEAGVIVEERPPSSPAVPVFKSLRHGSARRPGRAGRLARRR